ncbi:hypothetical protein [Pseudomonas sp. 5Ae-yellow]|uniref:hypothetical protein n=1 Tax=Pseudomonas sp. 5Ae-yellow TaxID=2759848 RepID=UPI0015F6C3B3|nr:hypothetical protein [Pseudomonas sp. 5Ae-yellow]MBA6421684.1 hypothetical protein [Pseudomonas sp. 5Ae-yellow]
MKNREKPVFLSALAVAMTGIILQAQAGFYDLYSGMLTKKVINLYSQNAASPQLTSYWNLKASN